MKKIIFKDFPLSKEMQKAIDDLGFEEATPIQSEAITVMMEGKDIIGQAQTGTGKTAAFGIPAIEMLEPGNKSLQVLILCPTRELAIQVSEEMGKLAKYKKEITFLPVYGGQPIERQLKVLQKGVQVVIGTPGRIQDHMERGTLTLKNVKLVVLDEADEMLDMGFRDDIENILKTTPKTRQTVMFSATMPRPIIELSKKYLKNAVNIKVVHEVLTVSGTEQIYFETKEKNKLEVLSRVIDLYNIKLALVFCNTKRGVDDLVEHLQSRGYPVEGLHGDMKQQIRERVMNKFRKGIVEILVATDVAARGLDVENIEAVFNYDMPQDEEYYVHRIGRTGRAGKTGRAFTFATGKDVFRLKDIQKYIKTKIKLNPIPSFDDVEEMRVNVYLDEIKSVIDNSELKKYISMLERLVDEEYTSIDIAAALLKMNIGEEKKSAEAEIDFKKDDDFRKRDSDFKREGDFRKRDSDSRHEGGFKKRDSGFKREGSSKNVRLFVSAGKKDNVRPGDILGAIAGESHIPGTAIGEIDMYDKFTFVNLDESYVDKVLDAMQGVMIRGKKVNVEVANKK